MDLERIIGAAKPELLQNWRDQTIPNGQDSYFYQSILKVGGDVNCGEPSQPAEINKVNIISTILSFKKLKNH